MADVVNLRTVRKRAKRRADEQRADTNRFAHSRSGGQRKLEKAEQSKANRDLDLHRIDAGDGR